MDTRMQKYKDTWIHGYLYTLIAMILRYMDTRIH